MKRPMPLGHKRFSKCYAWHNLAEQQFTVICAPLCPLPCLTAGTELKFICCGWFMGEAARAPIGAWDIWAFGRAMWLNWFIPVQKSRLQCSAMDTYIFCAMISCFMFFIVSSHYF